MRVPIWVRWTIGILLLLGCIFGVFWGVDRFLQRQAIVTREYALRQLADGRVLSECALPEKLGRVFAKLYPDGSISGAKCDDEKRVVFVEYEIGSPSFGYAVPVMRGDEVVGFDVYNLMDLALYEVFRPSFVVRFEKTTQGVTYYDGFHDRLGVLPP